jgi:cytochrome c oxidase assembly protein subunit 11
MLFKLLYKNPKNRVIFYTVLGIFAMFGFSYLMVPLYSLVCKNLGINGRTGSGPDETILGMKADTSRTIDVEFTATIHGDFPFVFRPLIHHLSVHPGEKKLLYYYAENKTGHPITIQAIPSIMPDDSAKYFKKTQCFCFTQQYFFDGEKADMPVYFYISPDVPKRTKTMVLSYTLYDVKKFLKKDEKYYRKGRIDVN